MTSSCAVVVAVAALTIAGCLGPAVANPYGHKTPELLRSLKGMQGLSISCDTERKLSFVHSYEGHPEFDFLSISKVLGDPIEVLVTKKELSQFKSLLTSQDIPYRVFIENVEDEVKRDKAANDLARELSSTDEQLGRASTFNYFLRYSEIQEYLTNLAKLYNNTVTVSSIGNSYEGRSINIVKISSGLASDGHTKPAILVDAGIHAREWIAPSTALWAIHQLVVNKTNSQLYANVDWYFIPSLNPDGYEFTYSSYRLWRKTRSVNPGSSCYGTDANRNFDFKWMTIGASDDACSDIHAGYKAFSEKETCALRDFVLAMNRSIKLYLTLHSYGQYMLHPWGYTSALPDNEPTLRSVAVSAEKALSSVRGTRYTIGSSTNVLYAAAGGSDDWLMAVGGAPLSYTIELPGGGSFGFNPAPSNIQPVGIETFEAFKVFGKYIDSIYA